MSGVVVKVANGVDAAHAFSCQVEAMGVVDEAVEYGIAQCRFTERFMMLFSLKGSSVAPAP